MTMILPQAVLIHRGEYIIMCSIIPTAGMWCDVNASEWHAASSDSGRLYVRTDGSDLM